MNNIDMLDMHDPDVREKTFHEWKLNSPSSKDILNLLLRISVNLNCKSVDVNNKPWITFFRKAVHGSALHLKNYIKIIVIVKKV